MFLEIISQCFNVFQFYEQYIISLFNILLYLQLKEPLNINNKNIKKVILPTKADNITTETGKATVTGWGILKAS